MTLNGIMTIGENSIGRNNLSLVECCYYNNFTARVVKLVNAVDSKSTGASLAGSSPASGTK